MTQGYDSEITLLHKECSDIVKIVKIYNFEATFYVKSAKNFNLNYVQSWLSFDTVYHVNFHDYNDENWHKQTLNLTKTIQKIKSFIKELQQQDYELINLQYVCKHCKEFMQINLHDNEIEYFCNCTLNNF